MNRKQSSSKLIWRVLMIFALGVPAHGQASASIASPAPPRNDNYRIGPGDVIDVVVSKNDALSRTGVRVTERGSLQLTMLEEDIVAACRTERQLADQVKEKYKKYIINPLVNVAVREYNSNPVALLGAVNSPGRFQLQRPTRLLELLTFVNGPSAKAGETIEIIRTENRPYCDGDALVTPAEAGDDIISIPLADTLKGIEAANPLVRSGDIIRVAEAVEVVQTNAYIQGNVKSSIAINLKEPVTLSQAVAMAGGLTPDAESEKITIRRVIPNSINRSQIVVNLKAINQGKRDDVLLEPNDIIDVPGPTGSKKFFKKLIDGVVPTILSPTRILY